MTRWITMPFRLLAVLLASPVLLLIIILQWIVYPTDDWGNIRFIKSIGRFILRGLRG